MELRRLLQAITAAEKEVICHLDGGGDLDMFVASAASKIYVSPAAQLDVESDVGALIGVEVMMDDAGVGLDSTTSATTGNSAAAAVEVVGSGERRQYRSSSDHERSGIFSGASPNSSRRASWERGGRGREER